MGNWDRFGEAVSTRCFITPPKTPKERMAQNWEAIGLMIQACRIELNGLSRAELIDALRFRANWEAERMARKGSSPAEIETFLAVQARMIPLVVHWRPKLTDWFFNHPRPKATVR
jgi:hypothetical protein